MAAAVVVGGSWHTLQHDGAPACDALFPPPAPLLRCQENNAIAVLDVALATILSVQGLGLKDHSKPYNTLDTSDADGGANIVSRLVFGLYQPDEMRSFRCGALASDHALPVTSSAQVGQFRIDRLTHALPSCSR